MTTRISASSRIRKALLLALAMGSLSTPRLLAENWPGWRGPTGNGASTEKVIALHWSPKENVKWRVDLADRGNSTPVVWGDRVFVTQATAKDHRRSVLCFGRADGKLLWQSGVTYDGREPTNGQNPYCSASPVTDGKCVVACFGSAGVFCYDLGGKEIWHRDLGAVDSWHGSGSSPVLYNDLCILNYGPGSSAAVIALSKETGDLVWNVAPPKLGLGGFFGFGGGGPGAAPPDDHKGPQPAPPTERDNEDRGGPPPRGAGGFGGFGRSAKAGDFGGAAMAGDFSGRGGFMGSWSTPLIARVADHDELIVVHATQVVGYDPKTGKELWHCAGLPQQVFASPAFDGNTLVATGHLLTGGTQAIALKPGGEGDVTATRRLWQIKLPKECVGSGVIHNGRVYLITEFGSVICLDLSNGKKLAEKRLTGEGSRSGSWSSLVLVDGKLLVTNQSGEVFIMRATPELKVLGMNSVGEETTCASPAISNEELFLRTYKAMWCIKKGEKGN